MAIISGGRINIWNAVKKQFEVIHLETETSRITDFADGIVQKLALTSAMTAVTALQSDSWFGKLLKMALTASGVKYSIAENGYVCLGDLFGGLIIQWGKTGSVNSSLYEITFPVSFPQNVLCCHCTVIHDGTPSLANCVSSVKNNGMAIGSSRTAYGFYWMVLGN